MLSAFTARPIIELKQRDKSKIETILAYGDRVLVGLNSGSLRVYRLNNSANGEPKSNGHGGTSAPNSVPNNELFPQASSSPRPVSKNGAPNQHPTEPPKPKPTDLLREVEKFSTRAIEQLAIIKEANVIVSLSNYHVSLHDLQTYELAETLVRTKNATCFAVTSNIVKDSDTGIPEIISRLAVAVKRRVLLWRWHESELSERVSEIALPEAIRTVTWAGPTRIVCGMNVGFVLVDVETESITEITGTSATPGGRFGAVSMGYMGLGGYVPKPLSAKLSDNEMLLAKDINTLFIDAEGKALEKRQIPWQSAPESIGYSYPYILALQPPTKGSLEIRNPETLNLLQTIQLAGAAQLHFPPPTVSLAHAGKGFHISSDRVVWKMDATDYDTQVAALIELGNYDEVISLLEMLEDALLKDKTGTLREVKMRKAERLFKLRKFRDSMDLFNEEGVNAPPERVLRLYPPMIAGNLSAQSTQAEETQDESQDGQEEQAEEAQKDQPEEGRDHSDDKTNGDRPSTPAGAKSGAATEPAEAMSPTKAAGFSRLWPMSARKADSDTASITSSKRDDDVMSIKGGKASAAVTSHAPEDKPLEGNELKTAVRELNSYLAGTRARMQRVLDPATGKLKRSSTNTSEATTASDPIRSLLANPTDSQASSEADLEANLRATFTLVDTTLFRGYMYSSPSLAGSLFRIPNFCDPDVVNEKLLEHSRYNELIDFFYGKKLHREALTLLRRFGHADDEENHAKKRKSWASKLVRAVQGGDKDKKHLEEAQADATEKGEATDGALNVEIDPSEIPEQLRGPQRTIAYLQSLPPDLIDLILEFSDWVFHADQNSAMEVFVADSENAETLPRERVVAFLKSLDADLGDESTGLEIKYLEHIINELADATPDFHNRLVELLVDYLKGVEEDKREELWETRMNLLVEFLRDSEQYGRSRAFARVPREDPVFYEAQAVILCKMGNHKQALEIYVFKMQDFVKAEDYCNRLYKSQTEVSTPTSPVDRRGSHSEKMAEDPDDPDATPPIYHTLLSLYLQPPSPHEPMLAPALDLLSKHGSRLPAESSLSLIPDSLSVAKLESYFRGRIRAANSKLSESRIVDGLWKSRLVDVSAALLLGEGLEGAEIDGRGGGGGGGAGRNRRVVIGEDRVCGVCHKRLGNSVVAVLPDNSVVHYGCLGRSAQAKGRTVSGGVRAAGAWGRSSG